MDAGHVKYLRSEAMHSACTSQIEGPTSTHLRLSDVDPFNDGFCSTAPTSPRHQYLGNRKKRELDEITKVPGSDDVPSTSYEYRKCLFYSSIIIIQIMSLAGVLRCPTGFPRILEIKSRSRQSHYESVNSVRDR